MLFVNAVASDSLANNDTAVLVSNDVVIKNSKSVAENDGKTTYEGQ